MFNARIDGLNETRKLLKDLPRKLQTGALRSGLRAGAKIVRDEARTLVAVKTGGLKRSIRIIARRMKKGTITVSVGSSLKYAHLLEYGTVRTRANPYLRPALDGKASAAVNAVSTQVREYLTKKLTTAKGK
jgi:HK97 gp10 family phage protein